MIIDNVRTKETNNKLTELLLSKDCTLIAKLKALLKKDLGLDVDEKKEKRLSIVKISAAKLHKPYINRVTTTCSLCNTTTVHQLVMSYSTEQKCYTASYGILNDPPNIPVHNLNLVTDNCLSCFGILAYWPKEYLIELLINRLKRDSLYIEKYHSTILPKEIREVEDV